MMDFCFKVLDLWIDVWLSYKDFLLESRSRSVCPVVVADLLSSGLDSFSGVDCPLGVCFGFHLVYLYAVHGLFLSFGLGGPRP